MLLADQADLAQHSQVLGRRGLADAELRARQFGELTTA